MPPTRLRRGNEATRGARRSDGRIGFPLIILLVWMFFEFGRPPITLGLPLLISVTSLVLWVARGEKQLGRTGRWWFIMLAGMAIMVPLAINNFAAYGNTRVLAILFLSICLPLQSLLRSVSDVRAWTYTFLALALYIASFAIANGGYGPSGAAGAQDENYVAALMSMAVPFAFFLMVTERRLLVKLLLTGSIVIFVGAVAFANNASRGGFLALCGVAAYIVFRSPRKTLAIGTLGVGGVALLLMAGEAFWTEIGTSADFETGTGDLRLKAWSGGLRMFLAHPILGVGPGNFPWQLGNYESTAQIQELGRSLAGSMVAHSMWVELMSELGLVGIACTLALAGGAWSGLSTVRRRAAELSQANPQVHDFVELGGFAFALQGAILGIAINGVFLSLLYFSHFWLLLAAGNALPYVLANVERQHAPRAWIDPPQRASPRPAPDARGMPKHQPTGYARMRS